MLLSTLNLVKRFSVSDMHDFFNESDDSDNVLCDVTLPGRGAGGFVCNVGGCSGGEREGGCWW